MRYRFGSLRARPGSSDYAYLLEDPDFGAPLTRALEEMLRVKLSLVTRARQEHRDLLEVLDESHPDRPWVRGIHQTLRRLSRDGLRLRLMACDYEPGPEGFLTIAASAPEVRFEVFPGDWMQVGLAAMRDGGEPVRVWPRLLREVCANGSLVCVGDLERHEGIPGMADAIERFLTPEYYGAAVEALRAARETMVSDPRAYLDEFQRLDDWDRLMRSYQERIQERFERDGDDSLYGLMNAITATAREVDDWGDRLDLEEMAGRIAWLRRPVPSRSGRGALVPA